MITVVGVLVALLAPHASSWVDRTTVRASIADVSAFYNQARLGAMLRGSRVRIDFSPALLSATYEGIEDSTFLTVNGPATDGVELRVSRRTIRIQPNGLGWGGANTKLVLRRGEAAESLTISREGRLKHWR